MNGIARTILVTAAVGLRILARVPFFAGDSLFWLANRLEDWAGAGKRDRPPAEEEPSC